MSLQENGEVTPSRQRQLAALQPAWGVGQSGNPAGRPRSARSKISESFLKQVYAEWEISGKAAIANMARDEPCDFVKMVASLIPKEFHVTELPFEGMTLDDVGDIIEAVRLEKSGRAGIIPDKRAGKAPRKTKPGAVTYSVR